RNVTGVQTCALPICVRFFLCVGEAGAALRGWWGAEGLFGGLLAAEPGGCVVEVLGLVEVFHLGQVVDLEDVGVLLGAVEPEGGVGACHRACEGLLRCGGWGVFLVVLAVLGAWGLGAWGLGGVLDLW